MLHFDDLNFIANANGDLKLGGPMTPHVADASTAANNTILDIEADTIARRINSYLGLNPPHEEIEATFYALVNIFSQLTVEGSERTEEHSREVAIGFPFRLKNAGQAYSRKL